MRASHVDHHIIQLQVRDLGDPKAAAARQADDHEIAMDVRRASGAWGQVGQDCGELAAGQETVWSRFQVESAGMVASGCEEVKAALVGGAVLMRARGRHEGKENGRTWSTRLR
jgi:hypothetical protein